MKAKHILCGIGVMLGGIVAVQGASALTAQEEVDIYFSFNPTIGLTLSDAKISIEDLTPGNAAKSSNITLTVSSNNTYGYKLLATAGDGDTYLNNSLVNGEATFTSVAVNAGTALTSLSDNTWGWAKNNVDAYYGLPYYTSSTPAEVLSTSAAGGSTVSFAIGAKAASTQASGEYKNVINFALVGNVEADSIDKVTTMQEFYAMSSANKASVVSSMVAGATYTLEDNRNDASYQITKLSSGVVWMTQNLVIANNAEIESVDSNFSYGEYTVENISSGLYDYCNVSAGTVCEAEDTTAASEDICPAGWRLPTSSELSASTITTSDNLAYSMNYSAASSAVGSGFAVRCVLK
ncbi:hypothetical protein IJQ51_01310 [Candidatus Saccharibacteria bacterium]|nr:hypothetical protein [Candidatus Saccharibacteria bacterium]